MGYSIKVNHEELRNTAKAIEDYVDQSKKRINTMNTAVSGMKGTSWEGEDCNAFLNKWQDVNTNNSVNYQINDFLQSYADFLKSAAEKYKNAQINAINKANRLPKW